MVSSTEGSPTNTGRTGRSKAASFRCTSGTRRAWWRRSGAAHRARAGLIMLRVHPPLRRTGARWVQLVDEGDDLASLEISSDGLQPLFESPVLGAATMERVEPRSPLPSPLGTPPRRCGWQASTWPSAHAGSPKARLFLCAGEDWMTWRTSTRLRTYSPLSERAHLSRSDARH